MYRVWKFPLDVGENKLEMPRNPKFLHLGEQHGTIMVWALVATNQPVAIVQVDVIATGHVAPSENEGMHIGTIQMKGGTYVYHVFRMRGTVA